MVANANKYLIFVTFIISYIEQGGVRGRRWVKETKMQAFVLRNTHSHKNLTYILRKKENGGGQSRLRKKKANSDGDKVARAKVNSDSCKIARKKENSRVGRDCARKSKQRRRRDCAKEGERRGPGAIAQKKFEIPTADPWKQVSETTVRHLLLWRTQDSGKDRKLWSA